MPLDGKVNKEDILTVLTKDFSSQKLQYYWDFNGVFLSQDKEIPVSLLNGSSGVLRIRVFGFSPRESAVEIQTIKIE